MKPEGMEEKLKAEVQQDIHLGQKADRERKTLIAQTAYLGTLGFLLVLPVVSGAYLGNWLDGKTMGFSFSWTVTLILVGVFVGSANVYLFVRERS